jgi:2-dehydro-3-deoxyphosphooctonate aldolase (KDO 8-P synthase)
LGEFAQRQLKIRSASLTDMQTVSIRDFQIGGGNRPTIISGPCVIEDYDGCAIIAERLKHIAERLDFHLIFKASFDKANRTSGSAFRGLGLQEGLAILERIGKSFDVPLTTDLHESVQADAVADVCDLLQIPAFLARQTDLLIAAAKTGKPLNVKKGQFMAPQDMKHVVQKVLANGAGGICLCERGTFFGYGRLVNDMQGLPIMRSFGVPVIFDATHSVQQPGGLGSATGGNREMVEPMARAAAAVGVDGFFFETHPNPDNSPSDGPNMIPLDNFEAAIARVLRVWETVHSFSS